MNGPWVLPASIATIAAAFIGGYFTYRAAKRAAREEAKSTWDSQLIVEGGNIRREAVERAKAADARADRIQGQLDDLRDAYQLLEQKCIDQDREIARLKEQADKDHHVMTTMRNELDQLRAHVGRGAKA